MAEIVYISCMLLSLACSLLLLKNYRRSPSKLIFWCAVCFLGLSLNNAMLFLDLIIFPAHDFYIARTLLAVLACVALLYAFIWEAV